MKLLGCVASVERGGNWKKKGEREGDWEIGSPFPFRFFLPLSLPGLFAPAFEAIEFAQYSCTVHNKAVVAKHLGSVLQFYLKDIEKSSDVYS